MKKGIQWSKRLTITDTGLLLMQLAEQYPEGTTIGEVFDEYFDENWDDVKQKLSDFLARLSE